MTSTSKSLILTLLISILISTIQMPLASEVAIPSVKYQTITWVDDDGVWIIDVSVVTESPWSVGRVVSISVNAVLRQAPANKSIYLVVRALSRGGEELSSKYLGELSLSHRAAGATLYLVTFNLFFNASVIEPTYPYVLDIAFEGYRGSKVFTSMLEFPVTISLGKSLLLPTVIINGNPNYWFTFEVLGNVNVSILLRNQGSRVIAWAVVEAYFNNELIGRRYVEGLSPNEVRVVDLTMFKYLTSGIYEVRALIKYSLPDGTEESVISSGIIEVVKPAKVIISSDKSAVIEGSKVLLQGMLTPASKAFIVLEKLVDRAWVPINATLTDVDGRFTFEWIAEDVKPMLNYVEHLFRVRVPVSAIGSNASIVSNSVTVVVYSAKRIADFIADLTLTLNPDTVFKGFNTLAIVRITPNIPVCIPVKLAYLDQDTYMWFELATVYACNSLGNTSINVNLAPGKYSVKALITAASRVIESLPRPLTVVDVPRLMVNTSEMVVYGGDLPIITYLTPVIKGLFDGFITLERGVIVLSNSSITLSDGYAELVVRNATYEGDLTIRACVNVYGNLICGSSQTKVLKASISITPNSLTADVNSAVRYNVLVSPPRKYRLMITLSDNSKVLESRVIETDDLGRSAIDFIAPSKPGSYLVTATLEGTQLSGSARLNVIEFIKSLAIELLNKSVQPLDNVYVRISVYPAPTTTYQVIINVQEGGKWTTASYGMITSGNTTMSFKAPSSEGQYKVKAVIPDLNIESNVETLNVVSRALLPSEYVYLILASAVVGGLILFIVGRRRR